MSKCNKCCKDCAFFHEVDEWYYDECFEGPMATLPNDPACFMFKEKKV